jgi:hypothetical protein
MRNRTADLLLTMETLCLLSYRGARMPPHARHQRTKIHTGPRPRRIQVTSFPVRTGRVLDQWGPGFEFSRDSDDVGTAAGSSARDSTSAISWSPNS